MLGLMLSRLKRQFPTSPCLINITVLCSTDKR